MSVGGTGPVDPNMLRMQIAGARDDASARSTAARDFMEAAMQHAKTMMGMLGGLLKGALSILGKGGGGKGGKG